MAEGDVGMTFTIQDIFTFVTEYPSGTTGDDVLGDFPGSSGTGAQERAGDGAQETIGRPNRGQTGTVS